MVCKISYNLKLAIFRWISPPLSLWQMLHKRWCHLFYHLALWSLATGETTQQHKREHGTGGGFWISGSGQSSGYVLYVDKALFLWCVRPVLRTGRCSAAAGGTKGVAHHLYSPGTTIHSSSNLCMSYRMPLSVPSMPYFALDLSHLISGTFYDCRDSLRQPTLGGSWECASFLGLLSCLLVRDVFEMRKRWEKSWQGGKRRHFPSLVGWLLYLFHIQGKE